MIRFLAVLLLLSAPAWADDMTSNNVLTTATQVFTPSASNPARKSLKVINRGSDTIYCSPKSDVTTNTGDPITTGASAAYPAVPVWCITTVNQTGSGTSRTLVWESDA
jgi:hypothetical protein